MLILVWVVYLCLSVNLRQMFCVTAVFLIVLFCIIWLALWLYNKSTWEEVCSLLLFVCLCFHRNTQKSQARLSWFACCFVRTKHPFPSYRIKPYLYCCCHGDIQLSAEAALQHPDWLIASRQVRLSSQHALKCLAGSSDWVTADSGTSAALADVAGFDWQV